VPTDAGSDALDVRGCPVLAEGCVGCAAAVAGAGVGAGCDAVAGDGDAVAALGACSVAGAAGVAAVAGADSVGAWLAATSAPGSTREISAVFIASTSVESELTASTEVCAALAIVVAWDFG
jgi:hypothetical protein